MHPTFENTRLSWVTCSWLMICQENVVALPNQWLTLVFITSLTLLCTLYIVHCTTPQQLNVECHTVRLHHTLAVIKDGRIILALTVGRSIYRLVHRSVDQSTMFFKRLLAAASAQILDERNTLQPYQPARCTFIRPVSNFYHQHFAVANSWEITE